MRPRRLSPLIPFVFACLGCSAEAVSTAPNAPNAPNAPRRAGPHNVIELFDSDTRELLDDAAGGGATVVEAFRVVEAFPTDDRPVRGVDSVGRFAATKRTRLPREVSATLAAALTDDRTYAFGERRAGFFLPGVAFRFSQRSAAAEVLLCFSSSEMQIRNADGQEVMATFEPGRDALIRVAKLALPDDAEVQALQPTGRQRPRDGME